MNCDLSDLADPDLLAELAQNHKLEEAAAAAEAEEHGLDDDPYGAGHFNESGEPPRSGRVWREAGYDACRDASAAACMLPVACCCCCCCGSCALTVAHPAPSRPLHRRRV